jgi:hypothetical protein
LYCYQTKLYNLYIFIATGNTIYYELDVELKESVVLVSRDGQAKQRRSKPIIVDSESEEECSEQQLTNYMIEVENLDPEFTKKECIEK